MKITIDLDPAELKQLLDQLNGALPVDVGSVGGRIAGPSAMCEDAAWRTQMRGIHQANLRRLQAELAAYPVGEKPLHLMNQVAAEERAIRKYGG